jgi:hypothetical protein
MPGDAQHMHMEECGDNVCVSCGLQNEPAGGGCICDAQDSTEVCGDFSENATVKVVAAIPAKRRWASSNGTLSNDKLKDQPIVNLTDTDTDSESKCTTAKVGK